MSNHLLRAQKVQDDEFYTQMLDIINGVSYYLPQLKDKIVYCNCDYHKKSNFVKFFKENFAEIGLKKLIATNIKTNEKYTFDGNREVITKLQDCHFETAEIEEILKESDVVVTNPPFSLFRRFFKNLLDNNKKFLLIAPLLALSYEGVFDAILEDKVRLGVFKHSHSKFIRPDGTLKEIQIIWLTNLDTPYPEPIELKTSYNPKIHKTYDNFHDFVNVPNMKSCPKDYFGWMGLPITFLYVYNPAQFELSKDYKINHHLYIEGKSIFLRVFARLKNEYASKQSEGSERR